MFAGIIALLSTSCLDRINVTGNGHPASETRTVTSFSKVKSDGDFKVYITNSEEAEITLRADENLLQYIETYVSGETLHIDIDGIHSVKAVVPMEVYIYTPQLEGIVQSGSGTIISDYFDSDHFDLILSGSGRVDAEFGAESADILLSGSGRINVAGSLDEAQLTISGSGDVKGINMQVKSCHTLTSGSGNMWINVEDYLDVRISGSGNVYYDGNPRIDTSISGSGNIVSYHQ